MKKFKITPKNYISNSETVYYNQPKQTSQRIKKSNKNTTVILVIIILFILSIIAVLTYGIIQIIQEHQNKIIETSLAIEISRQTENDNTYLKQKLKTYQNMKKAYEYNEVVEDFQENILGKYENSAYYTELKEIYDYCKTHNAKADLEEKQKEIETSEFISVSSVPKYIQSSQSSQILQSGINESKTYSFILNTSTKTYHLYECSATQKINPENRLEVSKTTYSIEEAKKLIEADGYKLCGICD